MAPRDLPDLMVPRRTCMFVIAHTHVLYVTVFEFPTIRVYLVEGVPLVARDQLDCKVSLEKLEHQEHQ